MDTSEEFRPFLILFTEIQVTRLEFNRTLWFFGTKEDAIKKCVEIKKLGRSKDIRLCQLSQWIEF